jgi:putative endonuclease
MMEKYGTKIQNRWYLYIIKCRDGSLYTGITTNVKRRLDEHQENKGAKYLRGRGPLSVVFKDLIGSHAMALKAESLVKKLPRYKKEQLILAGSWEANKKT